MEDVKFVFNNDARLTFNYNNCLKGIQIDGRGLFEGDFQGSSFDILKFSFRTCSGSGYNGQMKISVHDSGCRVY